MVKKYALSSEARSWTVDAGYFAKNSSTKDDGMCKIGV
jgi:hypothetical protein